MKSRHILLLSAALTLGLSGQAFAATSEATLPKATITPSDLVLVGVFGTPTTTTHAQGLTHRYVDGNFRLYSLSATTGDLYEWSPPSQATWRTSVVSAPNATLVNNFGDIFQEKLRTVVDNGSTCKPSTPCIGLSGKAKVPNSIYWDETTGRMYWASVVAVNSTYSTSDTSIGYAILNDATHTGTGVASFKVDEPNQNGVGGRWGTSWFQIPDWFSNAYLSGKRLGLGGGGGWSILSNGPMSLGPALFALDPPDVSTDTIYDYLSVAPMKLLSHLNLGTETRVLRNDLYPGKNYRGTTYLNTTAYFFDEDKCAHGVWIDTTTKSGLLFFANMGAGYADTTVTSVTSKSVFSVADPADITAGNLIRIATDYNPNPTYPFESKFVVSVSGNQITLTPATTGTIISGASVKSGAWYTGGGNETSKYYTPLYIYSPSDLALAAQGTVAPNDIAPTSNLNLAIPGATYPLDGTTANSARAPLEFRGVTFDSVTNYLYVMVYRQDGKSSVVVYRVQDT